MMVRPDESKLEDLSWDDVSVSSVVGQTEPISESVVESPVIETRRFTRKLTMEQIKKESHVIDICETTPAAATNDYNASKFKNMNMAMLNTYKLYNMDLDENEEKYDDNDRAEAEEADGSNTQLPTICVEKEPKSVFKKTLNRVKR